MFLDFLFKKGKKSNEEKGQDNTPFTASKAVKIVAKSIKSWFKFDPSEINVYAGGGYCEIKLEGGAFIRVTVIEPEGECLPKMTCTYTIRDSEALKSIGKFNDDQPYFTCYCGSNPEIINFSHTELFVREEFVAQVATKFFDTFFSPDVLKDVRAVSSKVK